MTDAQKRRATKWTRRLLPYLAVVIASLLIAHGNSLVRLFVFLWFLALGIVAIFWAWRATRDENGSSEAGSDG